MYSDRLTSRDWFRWQGVGFGLWPTVCRYQEFELTCSLSRPPERFWFFQDGRGRRRGGGQILRHPDPTSKTNRVCKGPLWLRRPDPWCENSWCGSTPVSRSHRSTRDFSVRSLSAEDLIWYLRKSFFSSENEDKRDNEDIVRFVSCPWTTYTSFHYLIRPSTVNFVDEKGKGMVSRKRKTRRW